MRVRHLIITTTLVAWGLCGVPGWAQRSEPLAESPDHVTLPPIVAVGAWQKLADALRLAQQSKYPAARSALRAVSASTRMIPPPPVERPLRPGGEPVRLPARFAALETALERLRAAALVFKPRYDAGNELALLKWCGVDPDGAEVLAREKALRARYKDQRLPAAMWREAARTALCEGLVVEKLGMAISLPRLGRIQAAVGAAVRAELTPEVGLLRYLHRSERLDRHDPSRAVAMPHLRLIAAKDYVDRLVAAWPLEEGDRIRELAAELLAKGRAGDLAALKQLSVDARTRFLPEAALALDQLAEESLERGRFGEAADRWALLRSRFPRGVEALPLERLVLRQAVVHALLGEGYTVEALRARAAALGLSEKPVVLGGAERSLAEHLEALRGSSGARASGLPTLGQANGMAWTYDYRRLPGHKSDNAASRTAPIAFRPLYDARQDRVLLRGAYGVVELDARGGQLRRSSGDLGANARPRTGPLSADRRKLDAHAVNEAHLMALDGDYLALAVPSPRRIDETARSSPWRPQSRLMVLRREGGRLVELWQRPRMAEAGGEAALADLRGAVIGTACDISRGKVLAGVTTFKADVAASWCYAFDLRSGRVLWRRFLCRRPLGEIARMPTPALSCRGGVAYVSTGQGVLAAVSVDDGDLRWLTRYPNLDASRLLGEGLIGGFESRWWLDPPRFSGDRLILAPPDSGAMVVLRAADGEELYRHPEAQRNPDLRYIAGVDERGWLYLGGRRLDLVSVEGVLSADKRRRTRLVAQASLAYDVHDSKDQLSGWRFYRRPGEPQLWCQLTRFQRETVVKLFDERRCLRPLAQGSIRGTDGVCVLKTIDAPHTPIGEVTVRYQRDIRSIPVEVHLPAGTVGKPLLGKDQLLVPTPSGVLRYDRKLEPIGSWPARRLPGYELGNLAYVPPRGKQPGLLLVASRDKLVAYNLSGK